MSFRLKSYLTIHSEKKKVKNSVPITLMLYLYFSQCKKRTPSDSPYRSDWSGIHRKKKITTQTSEREFARTHTDTDIYYLNAADYLVNN